MATGLSQCDLMRAVPESFRSDASWGDFRKHSKVVVYNSASRRRHQRKDYRITSTGIRFSLVAIEEVGALMWMCTGYVGDRSRSERFRVVCDINRVIHPSGNS